MNRNIFSFLFFLYCVFELRSAIVDGATLTNESYYSQREELMNQDASYMLGYELVLSPAEETVNDLLMSNKKLEYISDFQSLEFPPAIHFFRSKSLIEESNVFKFIQQMPKGSVLHVHDHAMASIDWVISNLTYWDDLYMTNTSDGQLSFRYIDENLNRSADWQLVSDVRASYPSDQEFDDYLFENLCLFTPFPEVKYPDINSIWATFESIFIALDGILNYKDAMIAYLTQTMTEFMEDNISYFEFRGILSTLYELNGTKLSPEDVIGVYKETCDIFVEQNPSFMGMKYIFAPPRSVSEQVVEGYVNLTILLKNLYPDFVLGFDLVGQEDLGKPLINFITPLLRLGNQDPPIPVFYHAGETDWQGTPTDENLFDALLLNSTRIGHGYAIIKHPALIEEAIQRDIPIEVCPLSNQILMLVDDLRNHPAVTLAANSFPLVVSSDDPSLWDALPLSHDLYEAFMGIGGAQADLRFLKQLAMNSIEYSALDAPQKDELMTLWLQEWDDFIDSQIQDNITSTTYRPTDIAESLENEKYIHVQKIR